MGCDIHLFAEIQVKDQWHLLNVINTRAGYWLFSRLANVRNSGGFTPISTPRGWPDDASIVSQLYKEGWGVDAHSFSWISAAEIRQLFDDLYGTECPSWMPDKELWKVIRENGIYGLKFGDCLNDDWDSCVDNVRWIFFFDN